MVLTDPTTRVPLWPYVTLLLPDELYVLATDHWRLLTTSLHVRVHMLIPIVCAEPRSEGGREKIFYLQWRTQEFFSGGVQQIQLRTERTGIWGR